MINHKDFNMQIVNLYFLSALCEHLNYTFILISLSYIL